MLRYPKLQSNIFCCENALQFISEITRIQPSEESGPGSLGERVAQVLGWKRQLHISKILPVGATT